MKGRARAGGRGRARTLEGAWRAARRLAGTGARARARASSGRNARCEGSGSEQRAYPRSRPRAAASRTGSRGAPVEFAVAVQCRAARLRCDPVLAARRWIGRWRRVGLLERIPSYMEKSRSRGGREWSRGQAIAVGVTVLAPNGTNRIISLADGCAFLDSTIAGLPARPSLDDVASRLRVNLAFRFSASWADHATQSSTSSGARCPSLFASLLALLAVLCLQLSPSSLASLFISLASSVAFFFYQSHSPSFPSFLSISLPSSPQSQPASVTISISTNLSLNQSQSITITISISINPNQPQPQSQSPSHRQLA